MKISFFGAAQNVTGSRHLLETGDFRLLLDCGLHQGKRAMADKLNRDVPFDPKKINAVILSHGHLDHCGTLPVLVKNGFAGNIYCTGATADIARYILQDAAHIQQQDAEYLNRHLATGQAPVTPLFTLADVEATLKLFFPVPYFRLSHEWTQLSDNIRFKFYDAGHILGSAVTFLEITENSSKKTLAYTGDLGKANVPILHFPEYLEEATETLLLECTYGDRNHRPLSEAIDHLQQVVRFAVKNKSKIIVPAFSLGRTQEIIYILHKLTDEGAIPLLPIYIDSPLAEDLVGVFTRHTEDFNEQFWQDFGNRHDRALFFKNLIYVRSTEESKALNTKAGPFMIIAASGMAEGGRVVHHLKNNLEDPNAIVLITGYQAQDTLGRRIQEGAREVRIFGQAYKVRSQVLTLDEFSAHADQDSLLDYLGHTKGVKRLFLVHTEPAKAAAFERVVREFYPRLEVAAPELGQSFTL